jgi:ElaB/YqjD/DUF883 family membrane-anchored ribosome-binding protein
MVKHRKIEDEVESIVERARALLDATSDVADEKVEEARQALEEILEAGAGAYEKAKESALAGAKLADQRVRDNPYQAVGIALGIGAALGFLLGRKSAEE